MRLHWVRGMFVLALFSVGCSNGGGGSSGPVASPASPAPAPESTASPQESVGHFTYELSFNGCSTGKQKFTTKKAYCDGLLNDSLNGGCARELRVETYNRMCTSVQPTQVNNLPSMSTARCVVNGMDLKDRSFLDNLNPFNPQRRQSFRDIYWDGKKEHAYSVMTMAVESYGKARFVMTPATSAFPALGEIRVEQSKGRDLFSVRAGLGSQLRLNLTNYSTEKEVEIVCRSDKSFRRVTTGLEKVKCVFKKGAGEVSAQEEILSWDLKSELVKEIYRGRGKESLTVRLIPASGEQEGRIAVEAVELGSNRSLRADSSLNEGIEVRYRGKEATSEISLTCAAASK